MCIMCVCVDSVLSRCLIFCQLPGKMPHLSAGGVVCVHVYYVCVGVDSVLSRRLIFCRLPAKMPHLSAGGVVCVHVCVCVDSVLSRCLSYLPRCTIFRQAELHVCVHVCVHVYYNVYPCAYALTLLSRYFVSYLPSCPIFWQAELCVCVQVYCLYMLMILLTLGAHAQRGLG